MKGKRRDKLEIFYEILKKCQNPARFTEIMRSTGTSFALLKPLLEELRGKGFLENKGIHWRTTKKGKEYIKLFEEIKKLLET